MSSTLQVAGGGGGEGGLGSLWVRPEEVGGQVLKCLHRVERPKRRWIEDRGRQEFGFSYGMAPLGGYL